MRPIRPVVPAVVLTALALVSAVVPAAAQATLGSGADQAVAERQRSAVGLRPVSARPGGGWSVVDHLGRRGIVLIEWPDRSARAGTLSLHLTGLHRSDRVRLVLSSAGCGAPSTTASRLASTWVTVDAKGRAWRERLPFTLATGAFKELRSVRLMEEEGIFTFCRSTTVWDDTDIVHRNGAYAILHAGPRRGIVVLGPAARSRSRVAWSLDVGRDEGDRLIGTSTGCAAGIDAASRLFSLRVRPDSSGISFFRGRTESVDKDETITIAGLHLRAAGGPTWACERPGIIAIPVG